MENWWQCVKKQVQYINIFDDIDVDVVDAMSAEKLINLGNLKHIGYPNYF